MPISVAALAWTFIVCASSAAAQSARRADSLAIITLEHEWLDARDSVALDSILAPDFEHPVAPGVVLGKRANVRWLLTHPRPAGSVVGFQSIAVRFYGMVALVNGIVLRTDAGGRETSRTLFTDVFVRRRGRWQAVNAQETPANRPGRREDVTHM